MSQTNPAPPAAQPEKELAWYWTTLLGIYLLVVVLLLAYMLYKLWPPHVGGLPTRSTINRNVNRSANRNVNVTAAPGANQNANQNVNGATPDANANGATDGVNANGAAAPASTPPAGEGDGDDGDDGELSASEQPAPPVPLFGGRVILEHSMEVRLLLIVLLAGALGAYIHATTSFIDYVGNRKLSGNWVWWYLLRPFIGSALALIFYFVVRGGFISPNSGGDAMNPFGIAALAGLVGMFSQQATDKLSEVFKTLFRTAPGAGDEKRKDSLEEGVVPAQNAAAGGAAVVAPPVISDIQPPSGDPAGDEPVTITGTNFVTGATVTFGSGAAAGVTVVDANTITLRTPAMNTAEVVDVVVTNPDGGSVTRPAGFTYTAAG